MAVIRSFVLVTLVLFLVACQSGSGGGSSSPTSDNTSNQQPVANAGADQTIIINQEVTLDGSNSTDPDGDTLSYAWTLDSVPPGSALSTTDINTRLIFASLGNSTTAAPSFTPDFAGSYVISLVVNDGQLNSNPDSIVVTANDENDQNNPLTPTNTTPVANAGVDQNGLTGNQITLDGSSSSDGDGDALTYNWTFSSIPVGSALTVLVNNTSANASFTPDLAGVYLVDLVVNDGNVNSTADSVTVTVTDPNITPVADAGVDQEIFPSTLLQLDGSASSDGDGDGLTYAWTITSAPVSSMAILSDDAIVNPTFTPVVPGNYSMQLIVNDGQEDSLPASVNLLVHDGSQHDSADSFPIAIPDNDTVTGASSTITVTGGPASIQFVSVNMSVTHTFDADLDIILESPVGTLIELSSDNSGNGDNYTNTVFTDVTNQLVVYANAPVSGEFQPENPLAGFNGEDANGDWVLHVYDDVASDTGALETWQLTFMNNTPPVADAGPSQSVRVGDVAQLDGSGASDGDGDTLTYNWTLIAQPAGSATSLDNVSLESPSFAVDAPGTYVAELVVNDGTTNSTADTVVVYTSTLHNSGDSFSLAIPQDDGTNPLVSTIEIVGLSGPILEPKLYLDITAVAAATIRFWLDAPNDSAVQLNPVIPAAGSNFTGTVFTDSAATYIDSGSPPYTGEFKPSTSFSPLDGTPNGTWKFKVWDESNPTSTLDYWALELQESVAPQANAGVDQTVIGASANPVTLNGNASQDRAGDAITYQWRFVSMPAGSKAVLSDVNTVNPTFIADIEGTYVLSLVVYDGYENSIPDTMSVVAYPNSSLYTSGDTFPIAILDPDWLNIPQPVSSTISVVGGPANISKVRVRNLRISHAQLQDIKIELMSPLGTTVILADVNDLAGTNINNTMLSDDAADLITSGAAFAVFYNGTFQPVSALSAFDGEDSTGTWTLTVTDTVDTNTGNLQDWELMLE